MSTERVLFLIFFLSVHAVIRSETEDKSNGNVQNSERDILDDEWDDMNSIKNLPFNLIIPDLENLIRDDLRRMEKNMPNPLDKDSDDFRTLVLPDIMQMNLPLSNNSNDVPKKIPKSKSERINEESSSKQNEILDNSSLLMNFLNSLGPIENEGLHFKKSKNSLGTPLDNAIVNKDFGNSIEPNDSLNSSSGLENQFIFNLTSNENPKKIMTELYFIDLGGTDDETVPIEKIIQNSVSLPDITMARKTAIGENELFSSVHRIMDDFADNMRNMMNIMRKSVRNISLGNESLEKEDKKPDVISKLNISIHYHGETYLIPSNAYVNRYNSGLVNITWTSDMTNINNSLCIKLSTDGFGNIIFQHLYLQLMKDNEMHKYKLDTPVYLKISNGTTNGTTIQLAESVGVKFSGPEILEVVTVDMTGNYSNHWLAFSIALLGLIVAGLIMLLSYIIFKKNQTYARKGSLSKEAIVY